MHLALWLSLLLTSTILLTVASSEDNQHISHATTQFSFNILKTVLQDQSGNVIISPVSIYALLAILQQGAHGNSRIEINNVLHALPDQTKEGYHNITSKYKVSNPTTTLEFASRAFIRNGLNIKPEFKESLVSSFLSDADSVNFSDTRQTTQHINSWVAENTHNRISQLFSEDSIPEDSVLVLVNAVYFMSYWDNPFYGTTTNRTFSPQPNIEKQVPSMYQQEFYQAGIDEQLGAKWVHLNFEFDNDYTVLLVLPTERHGLNTLLNHLTPENLTHIFSSNRFMSVKLTLPKFRLFTNTELIPVLKKLGLNDVFEDSADLSGISTVSMKLTKVIQKAEIAVDEDGVTASAATGFIAQPLSAHFIPNAEELVFNADHPFLFFIIDRQNSIPLFAGRVTDPTGS